MTGSSANTSRLVSLDAFRGMVIACMILVTDPGTYAAIYWPLRHADWAGWTPTDIISPGFLLAVGIAIPFATPRRHSILHILRRTLLLVLLGLFVNGFPIFSLSTLRLPGILQHIAVCYLAAALLHRLLNQTIPDERHRVRRMTLIASTAMISLTTYWLLLKLYPTPGFGPGHLDTIGSITAHVDRAVFGIPHLWVWGLTLGHGVTFDPDGLLSCLGSIAIVFIGVFTGELLQTPLTRERKAGALAAIAFFLIVAGRALIPVMPLIKKLWTPTFSIFSAGAALLAFAGLYLLFDAQGWRRGSQPFLIFGTNAIAAFVLSSIITTLSDRLHAPGTSLTLHKWSYQHLFLPCLAPIQASLAYALLIVLLNLALIYPLYRKGLFLRL